MPTTSVLDKVLRPGTVAVSNPSGNFQHELTNLWSPDTDIAKACVLDLAPPLYDPGYKRTIYDRSGKNNHGTIIGAIWERLSTGEWVLGYDGDDYILIADNSNLSFGAGGVDRPFSILSWVKISALSGGADTIVGKTSNDGADIEYLFTLHSGDALYCYLCGDALADRIARYTSNTFLATYQGAWTAIDMVYDGAKVATGIGLYANKARVDTNTSDTGAYPGMSDQAIPVIIGSWGLVSWLMHGKIGNVRIIGRFITASERDRDFDTNHRRYN